MEQIEDKDLGIIYITRNTRAKKIIARRKNENTVNLTVPVFYPLNKIKEAIEEMKPRLLNLKVSIQPVFDESYILQTLSFSVNIKKGNVNNFYVSLSDNILHIICPSNTNFEEDVVQNQIKKYIEAALRREAKRVIPFKIETLAKQYNFTFSEIKINRSRTRWGSCSSRRSVNISLFCMFLPDELLDFVILHELCHTIEMNHSDKFWALLDKVTDNRAKELTKQLNAVKISW